MNVHIKWLEPRSNPQLFLTSCTHFYSSNPINEAEVNEDSDCLEPSPEQYYNIQAATHQPTFPPSYVNVDIQATSQPHCAIYYNY